MRSDLLSAWGPKLRPWKKRNYVPRDKKNRNTGPVLAGGTLGGMGRVSHQLFSSQTKFPASELEPPKLFSIHNRSTALKSVKYMLRVRVCMLQSVVTRSLALCPCLDAPNKGQLKNPTAWLGLTGQQAGGGGSLVKCWLTFRVKNVAVVTDTMILTAQPCRHLHCVGPVGEMGYFNKKVAFRPDSWCFVTVDWLLDHLQEQWWLVAAARRSKAAPCFRRAFVGCCGSFPWVQYDWKVPLD